ncbi:hypothetical protein QCA50_013497 [Cerrena zonata]|uniref:Uncharacterized protein n=1 Tax=Cerrena zonata TaxID=2478898 RepID=A0AAW0FPL5_9APHY
MYLQTQVAQYSHSKDRHFEPLVHAQDSTSSPLPNDIILSIQNSPSILCSSQPNHVSSSGNPSLVSPLHPSKTSLANSCPIAMYISLLQRNHLDLLYYDEISHLLRRYLVFPVISLQQNSRFPPYMNYSNNHGPLGDICHPGVATNHTSSTLIVWQRTISIETDARTRDSRLKDNGTETSFNE